MANDLANRRWNRAHETHGWHDGTFKVWEADYSERTPYPHDSGVNVWVADADLGIGADILG